MQKKSLISLKTTKKASLAAEPAKDDGKETRKMTSVRKDWIKASFDKGY
jgi:hypothetical protein